MDTDEEVLEEDEVKEEDDYSHARLEDNGL
jgi:hypothetical protein